MKKISTLVLIIITIMILSMQVFAFTVPSNYTNGKNWVAFRNGADYYIVTSTASINVNASGYCTSSVDFVYYWSTDAVNWSGPYNKTANANGSYTGSATEKSGNHDVYKSDSSLFYDYAEPTPTPTPSPTPTPTTAPTTTVTTTIPTETTIILAEENEIQQTNYLKSIYIILAFALVLTAGGLVIYLTLKPIYLFFK